DAARHRARPRPRGHHPPASRPRRAARVRARRPGGPRRRRRGRGAPLLPARARALAAAGRRAGAAPAVPPETTPRGIDMDFSKLTAKAQEAIARAQELARARGNPEITPDHLLLALLETPESVGSQLLRKTGVDPASARSDSEQKLAGLPQVSGAM